MDKSIIIIAIVSFLIGCINFVENIIYKNTESLQKFTLLNKFLFFILALVKIFIALKVSTLFIPSTALEQMEIDYESTMLFGTIKESIADYEKYLVVSFAAVIAGNMVAIIRLKK